MPPVESSQLTPDTVDAAIDRALDTLESLAELGEDVDDEWQYVQDLSETWRTRLAAVSTERGGEGLGLERAAAIERACHEAGLIEDPHRAIDWLSTFPRSCWPPSASGRDGPLEAMRFQDAAPDARAVVYAGIQADPLVARAAGPPRRRELRGAAAREGGDERRIDRRGVVAGDVSVALLCRGPRPTVPGPSSPLRWPWPTAVSRFAASTAARSSSRSRRCSSAGVMPAAPSSAVRRERRILFDGVRAEIHPYDVTVEIDGAYAAVDCKWGARGISADVLHQLDDARSHAADDDERLRAVLVVFDSVRSCAVRLERQTAPQAGTEIVGLETLDELAAAAS